MVPGTGPSFPHYIYVCVFLWPRTAMPPPAFASTGIMPDPLRWIHAGVRFNLRLWEENNENNRDQDIGLQRRDAQLGIRPRRDGPAGAVRLGRGDAGMEDACSRRRGAGPGAAADRPRSARH